MKALKYCLCFVLLALIIFNVFALPLFAADGGEEAVSGFETKDVLSYTCVYNADEKKVTVNGSMHHDAFAQYNGATLVIYAIPPGMTAQQVVFEKPLAEAAVSIRFGFSFGAGDFVDRYSRYAVFLRTDDGKLTLGTEPQYPEVEAKPISTDGKSMIKGVISPSSNFSASVTPALTVIPVYLDRLYTHLSGGYVYYGNGEIRFFEKNYIDSLDARINSAFANGSRVYLQFLLSGGDTFKYDVDPEGKAEYYLPDLWSDSETLDLVHSATDFLLSRYNGIKGIDGIVLGKGWDVYSRYNFTVKNDLSEYVKRCGLYIAVVANSARSIDPSVDIVLPVSEMGFSKDKDYVGAEGDHFSHRELFEALMEHIDASFSNGLSCSLMVESSQTPFGISNSTFDSGIDMEFSDYSSEIYAGGQNEFSAFFDELRGKYPYISDKYTFVWSVSPELRGTALEAAYTYSYYALLADRRVAAFTVDLSKNVNYTDLESVLKYIDTIYGSAVTAHLPGYFGAESWSSIQGISLPSVNAGTTVYTSQALATLPEVCKGRFNYFDFSSYILTDNWMRGVGCDSIKLDYSNRDHKALKTTLSFDSEDTAQVIYSYDFYENMIHTPYLVFDTMISGNEDSLYRIELVMESETGRYEGVAVLNANTERNLIFDISKYAYFNKVESITLSVTPLGDSKESCELWIYSISGYSDKHDNEALADLIEEERGELLHEEQIVGDKSYVGRMAIAVGIIIIIGSLVIALLVIFRHGARTENDP